MLVLRHPLVLVGDGAQLLWRERRVLFCRLEARVVDGRVASPGLLVGHDRGSFVVGQDVASVNEVMPNRFCAESPSLARLRSFPAKVEAPLKHKRGLEEMCVHFCLLLHQGRSFAEAVLPEIEQHCFAPMQVRHADLLEELRSSLVLGRNGLEDRDGVEGLL